VLVTPRLGRAAAIGEPKDLPGVAVRKQKAIQDPVSLAAELFRKVYTDAMPEPGTGGEFALSPDATHLAFTFEYYGRDTPGNEPHIHLQSLRDGTQSDFWVKAWKGIRYRVS